MAAPVATLIWGILILKARSEKMFPKVLIAKSVTYGIFSQYIISRSLPCGPTMVANLQKNIDASRAVAIARYKV